MSENRGRSTEPKDITAVSSERDEQGGLEDEQDVEESMSIRQFKKQDKVIVPSFPSILQLSGYRTQLGTILVTAGGPTVCKESEWSNEVFNKSGGQFERLANSGKSRFGSRDIKLGTALVASIKAAPAHRMLDDEVLAMQLKCTDASTTLKGRQVYFMLLRYYTTTERLDLVYSIEHLSKLSWVGDNEMHTFRDTWDNILCNMVDNLAEISKRDLLFRKMEGSKELSEDMAHYRRLPEGHEDKSYAWLQNCIVRALRRRAERRNWDGRGAIIRGNSQVHAAPSQEDDAKEAKKQAKAKAKAKAKAEAEKVSKKEAKDAAAVVKALAKAKAAPKQKGKGKGKARSASAGGAGDPKTVCYHFKRGGCTRGAECWFEHTMLSKEKKKEILVPGSRSPSPAGGGKAKGKGKDQGKGKQKGKTDHKFLWCSHHLKPEGCNKGPNCPFPHLDKDAANAVNKAMKAAAAIAAG
jgi:hypothetical protein